MKKLVLFSFCFTLFAAMSAAGQTLTVSDFQFGTDVENRELVGTDSVFSNSVENIYCLTHITGARDTVTVTHVWYYNNEEKATVDLEVRSNSWRTWSSKRMLEAWTGNWSVDVLGPNGEILATKRFRIIEEAGTE